jgi:rubrerythrin
VVVIGAGNTAMDCLRTAKRLGAAEVRCVYRRSEAEAPARIEELRHAKEEGIEFFFLHGPVEIRTDADGNVCGMKVQKMELGEPDEKGRRKPVPTNEFVDLDCDTVIYALGTKANPIVTKSTPGLNLNKWGYIVADDATQATSVPGLFAGGDIVTGGATVILAMGAGRRAARAIGAYLAGGKSKWPITQEDAEAFVPPTPLSGQAAKAKPILAPGLAVTAARVKGDVPHDEEGEHDVFRDAATMLQWRCTGCGKVSEGFAYPYGMCPYCGGKLEALEARRIELAAAVDAVRKAFEIELGGQAFYRKAAEEAGDPDLKRLFASFAEMEKEHMDTLCRRYHLEVPAPSEEFQIERAAIYAGIENRPEDPGNLFRIAIAFEQRAVDFFAGQADKVAADSVEAQLYKELAAEEREHVEQLKTEYRRWQSGKVGML